jgi:hypothetical protein
MFCYFPGCFSTFLFMITDHWNSKHKALKVMRLNAGAKFSCYFDDYENSILRNDHLSCKKQPPCIS